MYYIICEAVEAVVAEWSLNIWRRH